MANKFTKSVLERQEKEYRESSKKKQPLQTVAPEDEIPPSAEIVEEIPPSAPEQPLNKEAILSKDDPILSKKKAASNPVINTSEAQKTELTTLIQLDSLSLNDFIVQEKTRTAKNKTFYLDTAVIQALKRTASAQKVTESKLVNDILKKILGVA